jgi:flagellar hook assembly protein FlgD
MTFPQIDLCLGTHQVTWNGTDLNGNRLPAGIYICKITGGEKVISRKIIMIR